MRWLVMFVVAIFIAGCGSAGDDPSSNVEPSATPLPSATPAITATPTIVPSPTPEPQCSTADGELAYDLFDEFAQEWEDAITIAGATGRIALPGPVQDLQRIRREVQRQEWPECASAAHESMIAAMDETIDGFIAFMQRKSDLQVSRYFDRATKHYETFFEELIALQ